MSEHKIEQGDIVRKVLSGEHGLVLKVREDLINYKYFIQWHTGLAVTSWHTKDEIAFLPRKGMEQFKQGDKVEIRYSGREGTVVDDNLKVQWTDDNSFSYPLPNNIKHIGKPERENLITNSELFAATDKLVEILRQKQSTAALTVSVYKVLEDLTKNHRKE